MKTDKKISKLEVLEKKARFRKVIRNFFDEREFFEVVTPLLVKNPGLEPNVRYFETEFCPQMGKGTKQKLYLPTSPEYHLKKALALGANRIYEITRAFRNGEWGTVHQPEFEMLEWYRQPGSYEEIAKDTEEMLRAIWSVFEGREPIGEISHVKVSELFQRYANIDLARALGEAPEFLSAAAQNAGVGIQESDSFEDIFHRVFLQKIEPALVSQNIVFVWDFPAPMRALSKLSEADPRFCKRFEIYWRGIELGNAFDEETDPVELRRVCEADRAKRMKLYGASPALDEEFIAAHANLQKNIGGIAMGVDRLFQWVMGATTLEEVQIFGGNLT